MLLFVLATIGLCLIIVNSYICQPVRDMVQKFAPNWAFYLVTCPQCMGFWCGGICYWAILYPAYGIGGILAGACAGSFLSSIGDAVLDCIVDASAYFRAKSLDSNADDVDISPDEQQ